MPFEPLNKQPLYKTATASTIQDEEPPAQSDTPGFKPLEAQPAEANAKPMKVYLADRNAVVEMPRTATREQMEELTFKHYRNDPRDVPGFFPNREEEWRKQGPIGTFELARRRDLLSLTTPVPYLKDIAQLSEAGGALGAVARLKADTYKDETEEPLSAVRFGRLPKPLRPAEVQRQQDVDTLTAFLLTKEEERVRGYTLGGRMFSGVAQLPAYIGEFILTGGLYTIGKEAFKQSIMRVAKDITESQAEGIAINLTKTFIKSKAARAAAAIGGAMAGTAVRSPAFLHMAANKYAQDRLMGSIAVTEKGAPLLKEMDEKPYTTFMNASADTYIELLSEVAGEGIGKVGGKVAEKIIPRRIAERLLPLMQRWKPNAKVKELMSKASLSGFLEEYGEERLGGFLKAVFNVDNFGAGKGANVFDRIMASWPKGQDALVEIGVLAFPQGARLGVSEVFNMTERREQAKLQEQSQALKVEKAGVEAAKPAPGKPEPAGAANPPISEAIREVTPIPGQPAPAPVPEADKPIEQRNALAEEVKSAEAPQGMEADYSIAVEKVVNGKSLTPGEAEKFPGLKTSEYRLARVNEAIAEEKKIGRPAVLSRLESQRQDILGELGATPGPGKSTSAVKHQVRVQTGQETDEEKVYSEKEALNLSLRAQARLSHLLDTVRKQEMSALEEKMQKGIAQAGKQTMENVKAVQQELVSILNDSELPREDKGRFITAVKNIQTPEQLGKALPEIQAKIKQFADQAKRETLRERISNELDQSKVKKQAGKPVGKFTPELQRILDGAREAVRMKPEQATMALLRNLSLYGDSVPPAEIAFQNRLLSAAAAPDSVSPESLRETFDLIRDLKATGRAAVLLKKGAGAQDIEAAKSRVLEIITGGKGVSKEGKSQGVKDLSQAAPLVQRTFKTIVGWNDLLDMLSSRDKSSKPEQSFLSQWADVIPEINAEKTGVRTNNERIREIAEQAYGLKDKEMIALLKENTREVSLGTFKFADGSSQDLTFTKDQAIKRWMELKDQTLDETFYDAEGMGYTPEIVAAIEKFLTPQDKAFAEAQMAFYQAYYASVNKVYRDIYGVDLPSNPNYSPIRRTGFARQSADGFGEFILDFQSRPSVAPGALKSRVKNTNVIEKQGSSQVLQQHIVEMERFKNWAYKIRELNAVFGDSEIRAAITENYGQKMLSAIDIFNKKFVREGADRAARISWVDTLRTNYTRSVLAIKPKIAVQQLMGFVAFSEAIPVKDFAVGVADFWRDPAGNAKTLLSSEMMKNRYAEIDRDIKDAVNSDAYKAYRKTQSFLNALMLNVQLGDKGAILQGGWAVYRYHRDQGMTHDFALREFERVANRTQQSGDVSEQSIFQSGGSFAKLLSMFQSNPNQYFRREYSAIRGLASGRMSNAQAAKMIALYHFILPMTFQFISDGLRPDKERQLRAAILGSANGIFIVGDMLERLASAIAGEPDFQNSNIPIFSMADYAVRAIKALKQDDFSFEDFVTAVSNLADVGGAATGLPVKSVVDMASSLGKIYEQDYRNGFFGLMGWSEWALGSNEKKVGSQARRFRR